MSTTLKESQQETQRRLDERAKVGVMLGDRLHLNLQSRRVLIFGLLAALALTGLLIAAVVDGLIPGLIFAVLAVVGMAVTIIGDLQKRDAVHKQRKIEERSKQRVKGSVG